MKKLLVLLMCFAVAVPATAADQIKFDKNGVYVSPEGWVFKVGPTERGWTISNDSAPESEESSPADYTVISRDGDKVTLRNNRNYKTYDCDRNGCR
ncbi:hypothetical protein MAF45_04710 [Mesosutterella sp. OilRF-GAM-744-9]|uniref:DUF5666 domain-containing protein n=1 Tax=Mesosutterella porci TaxID=2915351 RepID=A0ABS9MQ59_9BURK|nr:hypothetical protein [Mesosutterella sp. oilRF-744-WT-GAM-9]MCG5030746.1 hypothetical protein [Mesosutterella sp. oilRF-744-WT-GAM-9]